MIPIIHGKIERMNKNTPANTDDRAGIQSVEVAARLLDAMAAADGPVPLKELADAAGMAASKAHRYLVSMCRTGMMEQDSATGMYNFGRAALAIGLAALGRIDVVAVATRALRGLSDRTGATAVLAVWGEHGPTVIRFEESAQPVRMNVRVGSTLPTARSAIGQIFAAFLPTSIVRSQIISENRHFGGDHDVETFSEILSAVRQRRLNRNVGDYIPGVSAIAAPVFDAQGRLVAVVGLLGHQASLDTSWTGSVAETLDWRARDISEQLGFTGSSVPGNV
jgi:DNA-binding IclR family transcriptional regulator